MKATKLLPILAVVLCVPGIALRALHLLNALSPMLSSPSCSVTAARLLQLSNAPAPILVTEEGISMAASLLQP